MLRNKKIQLGWRSWEGSLERLLGIQPSLEHRQKSDGQREKEEADAGRKVTPHTHILDDV